MSKKSSSQSFDEWYNQIQQIRHRWSDEKQSFQEAWSEEKRSWSDQWKENVANARAQNRTSGKAPQGFLTEIVTAVVDAIGYAKEYSKQQSQRPKSSGIDRMREEEIRRRNEEYNRLVRKLETVERRIDRKKRTSVFMGILTGVFSIAFVFAGDGDFGPVALFFAGLTAWQVYNLKDLQQKYHKLRSYYDQFALGQAQPSYTPGYSAKAEKVVLRHAYERSGKVYPEMLVIESEFTLAEVEQLLNMCVDKRIASIEIDDKGRKYYYFSSLDNSDPYDNLTPPV